MNLISVSVMTIGAILMLWMIFVAWPDQSIVPTVPPLIDRHPIKAIPSRSQDTWTLDKNISDSECFLISTLNTEGC